MQTQTTTVSIGFILISLHLQFCMRLFMLVLSFAKKTLKFASERF